MRSRFVLWARLCCSYRAETFPEVWLMLLLFERELALKQEDALEETKLLAALRYDSS